MYSFNNDYSEGAIPEIMKRMCESNQKQTPGYGEDDLCMQAREKIQDVLKNDACDIHFMVGGTQTNLTLIAAALRPYEAVIAADSGHVNVHETGAIEATGHKVIIAHSIQGKLYPQSIADAYALHRDEHMVKPAMVYISNATEVGTIYTLVELTQLYAECQRLGMYLFIDGARLGSALSANGNDVAFHDLCTLCDVFYIGGTKNGALFGEALVIVNEKLKPDFRYMIKQRGGMLAKGRLLGIQFLELFQNDRYLSISRHANEMAMRLQDAFIACGYPLLIQTNTNQIFPILPDEVIHELRSMYMFQLWVRTDAAHCAMRFVTSWATDIKEVETFISTLKQIRR